MMKRIVGSNNREEVIVKKKNTHLVSFCFFLIITISFLIITKFSFINSFILSGVFFPIISCFIYISPFYQENLPYNTIGKFFCLHI